MDDVEWVASDVQYRPWVDSTMLRVDRVDVRDSDDEHMLILAAEGVHVALIRLRYDESIDEVINSAGVAARSAVNAWALRGRDLSLELDERAASTLGFARHVRMCLDLDEHGIRRVREALLEILQGTCFVVDTLDGRLEG